MAPIPHSRRSRWLGWIVCSVILLSSGGSPTPAQAGNFAQCQAIYDKFSAQAEPLRLAAQQKSDQAWAIAKQMTLKSQRDAKPYYDEAKRLRNQAHDLIDQGIAERHRCNQEIGGRLRASRAREEAQQRASSRRLAIGLTQSGATETAKGGGKVLGGYLAQKYGGEPASKRWKKGMGAWTTWNLGQGFHQLSSGQSTWREKYAAIFTIGKNLTSLVSKERAALTPQYSLAHLLSGQATRVAMGALEVITQDSLSQFKQAMTSFNQTHTAQIAQQRAQAEAARLAQQQAAAAAQERARQHALAQEQARQQNEALERERAQARAQALAREQRQWEEEEREAERDAASSGQFWNGVMGVLGQVGNALQQQQMNRALQAEQRRAQRRYPSIPPQSGSMSADEIYNNLRGGVGSTDFETGEVRY